MAVSPVKLPPMSVCQNGLKTASNMLLCTTRGMSAFSGAHGVGRGGEYEAEADIDMDCAANNFFLMISSSVLA